MPETSGDESRPVTAHEKILVQAQRFEFAASDMRDVVVAAEWFAAAEAVPPVGGGVIETGIVVTYARPFTDNGIGRLDPTKYRPKDRELAALHRRLIALRDTLLAHTDSTALRRIAEGGVADIDWSAGPVSGVGIEPGRAVEVRVDPFARPEFTAIARLAREQVTRFEEAAEEARAKLPAGSPRAVRQRITLSGGQVTVKMDET
jgi:hypothetical protein